jgi:AraC-like DNA-binding protein
VLSDIQTAAPAPLLARHVEDVQVHVRRVGRKRRVELLPDGTTSLLFRVVRDGCVGDVSVVGPRTRAVFKTAPDVPLCVVVRFRPGAGTLLVGVPASDITDRFVRLDDIWGPEGASVCQRLLAASSPSRVVEELQRVLVARLERPFEPASLWLARRAVRIWQLDHSVRVSRVAEELGITARHLRRAFIESVGIRPKEFVRMVRLQKAVRAAGNGTEWARIAMDAGYYDQAHLNADFRDLLGITPTELLAQRRSVGSAFAECPST